MIVVRPESIDVEGDSVSIVGAERGGSRSKEWEFREQREQAGD